MSSERDALFRSICADDEDDTPRLVFADWLDEHDEPARAEFIRLQVEHNRLMWDGSDSQAVYVFLRDRDWVTRPAAKWKHIDPGIARRVEITNRIQKLWKANNRAWTASLPKTWGVTWHGFIRGFPCTVEVSDLVALAEHAKELRDIAPPLELVCGRITNDDTKAVLESGLLSWVRSLSVPGHRAEELRAWGRHPAVAGIRALQFRGGDGVGGAGLSLALSESPHWSGLRSLEFDRAWLEPEPAVQLFQAAHLRNITSLQITGLDWTPETIRAFTSAKFSNLTDLRFVEMGLNDDAAEALANTPTLSTMRHLDVGYNSITGRGATALLTSPHLKNVAFLGLEENPLRGLDRTALKRASVGGLRLFHAHGCSLSLKDVGALARCPRLHNLWYLDLDDNNLQTGAVRELVAGLKGHCPPILWLTLNRIGDDAAKILADWPAAKALRVLELYQNPMTDAGVRTLLNSPFLKNLDGLGVPYGMSDDVEKTLRKRFRSHARIE